MACSFVQNARCFMWHLYSKKEVSILFSGFSFGHEGLEMTIHSISDGTPAKSRKLEQNYVNFPVLSKLFNHPLPSTRLQRNEPPLLTTRLFFHIEEDLVHFSPFLQKLGQLSTKRWFIPGLLQIATHTQEIWATATLMPPAPADTTLLPRSPKRPTRAASPSVPCKTSLFSRQ